MKLSEVPNKNIRVKVSAFNQGYSKKIIERLRNLGIVENKTISILHSLPFGGPVVVHVGCCVFSLSREVAQWVEIEPETSN